MTELLEAIRSAKREGFNGVAVWSTGGGQYMAAVLDRSGRISDPRCWHPEPSAEAAAEALVKLLDAPKRTP